MSPARGDAELPPLPDECRGLRGLAMVRAAYAATRPARATTTPRKTPFAVSKAPKPEPSPWTPHDTVPPTLTPGHWADGAPIPDEPPLEEDL